MTVITVILVAADIIANSYFVKKFGGSTWGERGAAIAVIIGSFIYPPFGILFIPPIIVFIIEYIQHKKASDSLKASVGSFLGFLGGAVAKIILQIIMIIWFFFDIFLSKLF